MNGNFKSLKIETGQLLHYDTGIQLFGCPEFTHTAVEMKYFSAGVVDEFGALIE